MYDVPNGEDEQEEVEIMSAETYLAPTYSLKGRYRYCNGDTQFQSGIFAQMNHVCDCLKVTTPWLML